MQVVSFRNGHAKRGGRKAGTPNRNFSVRERLAELDCDPVAELVLIARDPSTSPELKSRILRGILDFISPKLRAVDQTLDTPDGSGLRIEIVRVAVDRNREIEDDRLVPNLPSPLRPV